MKVLGIDTSTKTMSIALLEDSKISGEIFFDSNMDHSEKLIDNIKYLLEQNDISIKDVDLFSVAIGPGSFTGIRIGIATIKGLTDFLKKPAIGVSSLEALSRNFSSSKIVITAVDAKRERVYGAIYDYSDDKLEIILKEGMYPFLEFIEKIEKYEGAIIAGDVNSKIAKATSKKFSYAVESNLLNRASNVAFIAAEKYKSGDYISNEDLKANYFAKPQAVMELEKR